MGAWVEITDRMPVIQEATKLKVKILSGTVSRKEISSFNFIFSIIFSACITGAKDSYQGFSYGSLLS